MVNEILRELKDSVGLKVIYDFAIPPILELKNIYDEIKKRETLETRNLVMLSVILGVFILSASVNLISPELFDIANENLPMLSGNKLLVCYFFGCVNSRICCFIVENLMNVYHWNKYGDAKYFLSDQRLSELSVECDISRESITLVFNKLRNNLSLGEQREIKFLSLINLDQILNDLMYEKATIAKYNFMLVKHINSDKYIDHNNKIYVEEIQRRENLTEQQLFELWHTEIRETHNLLIDDIERLRQIGSIPTSVNSSNNPLIFINRNLLQTPTFAEVYDSNNQERDIQYHLKKLLASHKYE